MARAEWLPDDVIQATRELEVLIAEDLGIEYFRRRLLFELAYREHKLRYWPGYVKREGQ